MTPTSPWRWPGGEFSINAVARADGGAWDQAGESSVAGTQAVGPDPVNNASGGIVSALSAPSNAPSGTRASTTAGSPATETHAEDRPNTVGVLGLPAPSTTPGRGGSTELAVRSADVVGTARGEAASGMVVSDSPASSTVTPSTTTAIVPDTSARDQATPNIPAGRVPIDARARGTLDPGVPKGPSAAGSPAETPIASDGSSPDLGDPGGAATPAGLQAPDPQLADVITSLVPFGRASLEDAIGQFLEPFDDLATSMPGWHGPSGLIGASLAVAVTVVGVEVAIRFRRSRSESDGELELPEFPGLPAPRRWS